MQRNAAPPTFDQIPSSRKPFQETSTEGPSSAAYRTDLLAGWSRMTASSSKIRSDKARTFPTIGVGSGAGRRRPSFNRRIGARSWLENVRQYDPLLSPATNGQLNARGTPIDADSISSLVLATSILRSRPTLLRA